MKHSKKIILLWTTISGFCISSNAQNMFVRQQNGTQHSYAINELKSIKFSLGNVFVHKNNGIDNFQLDTIRYINFTDLMVGINETNRVNNLSFALFPNPANNQLNISFSKNIEESGIVTLYTIEGKIVLRQLLHIGSNALQFNISNLNTGMYICSIQIGNQFSTQKFIKN